jgi:hypothetical protein
MASMKKITTNQQRSKRKCGSAASSENIGMAAGDGEMAKKYVGENGSASKIMSAAGDESENHRHLA